MGLTRIQFGSMLLSHFFFISQFTILRCIADSLASDHTSTLGSRLMPRQLSAAKAKRKLRDEFYVRSHSEPLQSFIELQRLLGPQINKMPHAAHSTVFGHDPWVSRDLWGGSTTSITHEFYAPRGWSAALAFCN